MMDVLKIFWTTLYSLLSGINRFAVSFDAVAQVVEVNAENFKEQELMEAKAKTAEVKKRLKEVA